MVCSMSAPEQFPIEAFKPKARMGPEGTIHPHIARQVADKVHIHDAVVKPFNKK